MICGVYRIRNKADGKSYIGSSYNIKKRWKEHRGHLRRGTHHARHLLNAWNKYGEASFVFEVLVICAPDMRLFYEQALMDGLKPRYNVSPTAGSIRGSRHTPEAKANMSAAQRGWRKKYKYQGEMLCLSDIADRAGIDCDLLISRVVGLGFPVVEALARDRRAFRQTYEYEGRALTSDQWAVELGMHKRRIAYWLASGMTIADCVQRLNRTAKRLSFAEFCRVTGVNLQTTKSRVQGGMDVMAAVMAPVFQRDQSWRTKETS